MPHPKSHHHISYEVALLTIAVAEGAFFRKLFTLGSSSHSIFLRGSIFSMIFMGFGAVYGAEGNVDLTHVGLAAIPFCTSPGYILSAWRNWQTRQTVNLVGRNSRVGSGPTAGITTGPSRRKAAGFFVARCR